MRKFYFLLIALSFAFVSNAQLTGTKTIPGDYATISAAVTALNTSGVGTGGVTFNVAAGYTESTTAQILLTATGTAANPIVFQKSGTGVNPLITRTDAGTNTTSSIGGLGDAIIRLDGSDYVTFSGISVTATSSTIEYGYMTSKPSATDGCKNVTINNSTITMNKGTSAYVIGIYIGNGTTSVSSATGVTVSAASGTNQNITITGNIVQNVHAGIYVRGSSATGFYDDTITIGQPGSNNGNIIQNFGGGSATTTYGVYFIYVSNPSVVNNTINNIGSGGVAHTSTFYGVFFSTVGGDVVANTNSITIANSSASSASNGIYNGNTCTSETYTSNYFSSGTISSTGTVTLIYSSNATTSKSITGNSITGTFTRSAASGTLYCYYNLGSPGSGTETFANNVFTNISVAGSSALDVYYSNTASGHNRIVNNNTISSLTIGSSTSYAIYSVNGTTSQVYNNIVSNITSTGTFYGVYFSGTGSTSTVYGNSVTGLTNTSTSSTYGLYANANTSSVYSNTVNTFSNSTAAGSLYGIYASSSATTSNIYSNTISGLSTIGVIAEGIYSGAPTATIYKNKIHTLSSSNAAPGVYGIYTGTGTVTANINNNIIGSLTSPAANSTSIALAGIALGVATNANLYYNTVSLNAASTGATFNSAALFALSSTNLTLNNNILINNTTASSAGLVAAYFRSNSTLTAYASTSNNNLFYAGTPGASNVIFADGTNTDQTLSAYKSRVAPRDGSSISELTPFASTTGSASNYLHISTSIASQVESAALPISGITDDFDGDPRNTSTPDIGADEGAFILLDLTPPTISYTALPFTCATGARTLTATITDFSGVPTSGTGLPVLYWKVNSGTYSAVQATYIGSNQYQFSFGAGVSTSDVISYYVVATDNATTPNIGSFPSGGASGFTTNPPAVSTPPTSPSSYTIATTMSGTYTVGSAVGNDYPTLTAAITAYNTSCLSGPVVFNLTDATYSTSETFPIVVNYNSYASSTNTLTIKVATGVTTTITGAAASSPLIKVLSSYVTIDGSNTSNGTTRDLTISNTSTTSPNVIAIGSTGTVPVIGSALKNTICINGVNTASAIIVSDGTSVGSAGYFNNISIINNSIQKAYIGLYVNAIASTGNGSGLLISGNDINSSANPIRLVGIYVQGVDGAIVSNNNLANFETASAEYDRGIWLATGTVNSSVSGNTLSALNYTGTSGYGPAGILISSSVAAANVTVSDNTISGISSSGSTSNATSGITVSGATGGIIIEKNKINNIKNTNSGGYSALGVILNSSLTSASVVLKNNFIYDIAAYGYSSYSTDNGFGINVLAGGGYGIYHNTVNMQTAQTSTSGITACLLINSSVTTAASLDVRNNIFVNTPTVGTDRFAVISNAANTVFANIDYNDYYSSGSNIGYISSTNQANLAAMQASFGGNTKSVSFNPTFTSATDLHLTNTAGANWCLDGKGTPISTVTTDIDGDTRSTTKPDIGADEFNATGFTVTNPAVICAPNTVDLTAAAVTAGSMNGLTFTYFTDAAATTTLTNANAVAASGTYYIKATNGSCSLVYPVTVTINAAPATFNVTGGGTYCSPGAGFALGLDGSATGINYQLYNGATTVGSAVAGTGSAISFGTQTDGGTYTVVATDATTSCTATMTGSAVIVNNPKPTAFNVTGTGSYCSGGTGLTVGLSGSETGISYQLFIGGNLAGSPVAGTGSAISFGVQTTGGTYTVVASNTTTSCTENMTGSAVITVNPVPVISTTLFQPTTCASTDGEIVVAMSGAAGPYTFSWSTTGGNGLVSGVQTQTTLSVGSYTLVAQAANGCSATSTISLVGPGGCSVCPSVPSVSANMYPVCAGNNFTLSAAGLADMGISYGVKFLYSATALVNPYSGGTAISTVANSSLFANGTIAVTTTSISTPGTYYMYAILSPAPVDPNCRPYAVTQLTIADIPTLSLGANPSVCYSTSASAGTISYTSSVAVSTYNVVWNAAALAAGFTNVTNGTISGSSISLAVPAGAAAATYSGTITVSSGSGCASSAVSFSVTVNPTPTVNAVSDQTVCNGAGSTAVTFAGAVTGTTYSWTNSNPAIGLASSGTGNIASFTAVNTGTTPVTSTVTVTPSAFGPAPGVAIASPVTINYADRYITYTGVSINGGSNSAIVAAGSSVSLSYNYSVAFDYGTGYCPGCVVQFYVGLGGSSQTLTCVNPIGGGTSGSQSATFTAPSTPGVYYLTQSGTLDYVCQPQAFNNLPSNAIGYIQVGATGCVGAPRTFTITVNPTPTVAAVSNQALCNGLTTTAVAFTGTVTGTTYSWTNSAPSIGLAASGTGNIPAFTAVNTGATAVTATITVTPSANGCAGTPITYTYTVNPTSTVNAVSNQTVCNGAATSAVTFSGAVAGEVFSWTNNTTSIGLAAAGTGNIPSFTAVNTGTTPVTATVSVTANVPGKLNYTMYSTHGGNGNTSQYGQFANTAAEFDNMLNTANSNTVVSSTGTANPASVIYWNGSPALTAAGISVPNGGDFFALKATGTFVAAETGTYTFAVDGDDAVDVAINGTVVCSFYGGHGFGGWHTGTIDLVAGTSYTFTARFQEFGGGEGINVAWKRPSQSTFALQADEFVGGCASAVRTFTITVNPTPTVAAVSNQTVCNGSNTTAVTFSGAVTGTTYAWTNSNTAIGLAASGTGNIASFAGTNTTAAPITSTITATPSANGCTGSPTSFTITVNPTATVNAIASQVLCKGSNTTAVTFAGPVAGTTYAWTNSNTAIGLAASGTGTGIPSFATTNTTTAPLVGTITVTPTANGCVGTPLVFTITVNPTPTVAAVSNQVLCHGSSTAAVTFAGTVTGTVFNWTNTNTSIGLAASGSGNIASFVATNTGSVQQVATITVTPSYTNGGVTCLGTPITFTITVNPLPVVSAGTLPSRICISDSLVALNGTPVGGYWTGIGTSGFNFVPNAAALGSYTLRYTFTDANNCTNSATIVATVNECAERNRTLAAGAVTLFPNPNDGNFYLKVNSHLFNNLSMRVYNAAGQLVSTKQWSGVVYGRTMAVNLTNLPAGIYVVQLYYGDGQEAGAKVSYRIILGH